MREDGDVGLGGMVATVGAPDMTAEAGMGLLSRSTLGLEGSSAVKSFESCKGKTKQLYLPIVINPGDLRTKLLLLIRKCCCAFYKGADGAAHCGKRCIMTDRKA